MRNKTLILFIIFLLNQTSLIYSFLNKETFYVTKDNKTSIYANFVGINIIDEVPYAFPITSLIQKGMRVQFDYKNKKVWVELDDLLELNFTIKNFSEDNLLYHGTTIINKNMWFAYKNILYKMDLNNPQEPTIKAQVKLPKFADMIPSDDRTWWLLKGTSQNSNNIALNLALFDITNHKFVPLTIFYGDNITLESVEFSPDNKYLAILLKIEDNYIVNVYNILNKTLCISQDKGLGFSWNDNQLIIYTPKSIVLYNDFSDWKSKFTLYSFKIAINNTPTARKIDGELFLTIKDIVYKLENNTLKNTGEQFIEYSPDRLLKYYEKNNIIYTYYKNRRLRSLSGKDPSWTFIAFLDNKNILYKAQKGAITSIYVYNIDSEESSIFRWIEEPTYLLPDHTAIEAVIENDEVWIFIEQADKWAKILRLHELLK